MPQQQLIPRNNQQRAAVGRSAISSALNLLSNPQLQRMVAKGVNSMKGGRKKYQPSPKQTYLMNDFEAPVALGTRSERRAPSISNSASNGMIKIRNREIVDLSVLGSTAWTLQSSFALNPGLPTTFPWLSSIAQNYQEYRFSKLCFSYVPIAPTSTQGDIILTPVYDASARDPVSETQASDQLGTVTGSCWGRHTCSLKPSSMFPMGPKKYIRTLDLAGDLKTYDAGNMHVSSVNQTGASAIGKLFVEYEVELYVPRLVTGNALTLDSLSQFNVSADQNIGVGVSALVQADNPMYNGLRAKYITGDYFLPAGFYKVEVQITMFDTTNEATIYQVAIESRISSLVSVVLAGGALVTPAIANSSEMLVLTGIWDNSLGGPNTTRSLGVVVRNESASIAKVQSVSGVPSGPASFIRFSLL